MNLQNLVDYYKIYKNDDILSGVVTPDPIDPEIVKSYIMMRCGLLTPVYNEPELFKSATSVWFSARSYELEHLVKILEAKYSPIENVDRYDNWTKENTGDYANKDSGTDAENNTRVNKLSDSDVIHDNNYRNSGYTTKDDNTVTETASGEDTVVIDQTVTASGTDTVAESGTEQRDIVNSGTDTTTNTISAFNSATYQPDNQSETTYGKSTDDDITFGKSVDTTYGKSEDTDNTTTTTHGKVLTTVTDNSGSENETENELKDRSILYGKREAESVLNNKTYGHNLDNTHHDKDIYSQHLHGNIGVTTNQKMQNEELDWLERFNVYDWIASQFENDMMVCIY